MVTGPLAVMTGEREEEMRREEKWDERWRVDGGMEKRAPWPRRGAEERRTTVRFENSIGDRSSRS
jgi:hypothetical protein